MRAYLADEVAADAAAQAVQEVFIFERVAGGAKLAGTYLPNADSKAAFAAWKKARDCRPRSRQFTLFVQIQLLTISASKLRLALVLASS